MPSLSIWSKNEIHRYEYPPEFTAAERKKFFTLPESLLKRINTFHHTTNQIGFQLMFGYFKAVHRFFIPNRFPSVDVQFVCRRRGILPFAVDMKAYHRATYWRHQKIILRYFGYTSFQADQHTLALVEALHRPLHSQVRPKLIMDHALAWLDQQRIERPSYYTLHTIITTALEVHYQQLSRTLQHYLQPDQQQALESLLETTPEASAPNAPYVLTRLKRFTPSERTKHIKANLERVQQLWRVFRVIKPLVEKLALHPDAIRHFGEMALQYEVFQLIRRNPYDKYLYLIAFVTHQVYFFEDALIDTFLSVSKKALHQAQQAQKEYLYLQRRALRASFEELIHVTQEHVSLLINLENLLWQDEALNHAEKTIQQLRQYLPQDFELLIETQQALSVAKRQEGWDHEGLYYQSLEHQSLSLQRRLSGILSIIHFHRFTSEPKLMEAIQHFRHRQGDITETSPVDFLPEKEQALLRTPQGKFRISLYKSLLFKAVHFAIKDGSLNLQYSYRYKAFDEYLIPVAEWQDHQPQLLQEAGLSHLQDGLGYLETLKDRLDAQYHQTNRQIQAGQNPYLRFYQDGSFHVNTPAQSAEEERYWLFPTEPVIPLSEVLATIEQATHYLQAFHHRQPRYQKKRPTNALFYASITALGCNLGIPTMGKVGYPIETTELEQTVHWYMTLNNLEKATSKIVDFTATLELARWMKSDPEELHTSSDGQKIAVASQDTPYASRSFKYFGKGRGITAYSFIDERYIPFYSTVINTTEREATYVLDGLLHNETIQSTQHSTDTHGYSEAVFALMDLAGFGFAPRIAKLYKQQRYACRKKAEYAALDYAILPHAYVDEALILGQWNDLLRLMTSIKLKVCTASQVMRRLNSYSRQHPIYQALKEYGRIHKTVYILRYLQDVELRQAIQKQLSKIEQSNRFSQAIFFANGGEMIYATREEQQIAEACKSLIKNAIICWNYLYLSQKIRKQSDLLEKQQLLQAVKASSIIAWRHIYFHGFYDFSDEKLMDSFRVASPQNQHLGLT